MQVKVRETPFNIEIVVNKKYLGFSKTALNKNCKKVIFFSLLRAFEKPNYENYIPFTHIECIIYYKIVGAL